MLSWTTPPEQPLTDDANADEVATHVKSTTAHLRPVLPKAALYGLSGAIACAVSKATGADPAGILLQFLAMLGNCVGPQPHVWFGNAKHSARLFVLLVGDAALGLKGTSQAAVADLFAEADPAWYRNRVHGGVQSPEAMIELVADGPSGDCRLLIFEAEYQRLVSRSAASGTFAAQLRRAFDGGPLQINRSRRGPNDTRSSIRASHPHVSLIAHITPEEFTRILPMMRRAGGLETRLIVAIVHRQAEVNPFGRPESWGGLVDHLRIVIEWSRARVLKHADPISRELCLLRGVQPNVELLTDPVISQRWDTFRARFPQVDPDYAHLLHRGPVQVMRLAVAYAIADMAPCLMPEHVDAALGLWEFCAKSAERVHGFPTGSLPPRVDPKRRGQLLDFLSRHDDWVSREQVVSTLFSRNVSKDDVDAIVESLKVEGFVEQRTARDTGGRPRIEYRLVPPPTTA